MASALAVYASPSRLAVPQARLATGCWSGFAGWDSHPLRLQRKVSAVNFSQTSSFPKLLGAMNGYVDAQFVLHQVVDAGKDAAGVAAGDDETVAAEMEPTAVPGRRRLQRRRRPA